VAVSRQEVVPNPGTTGMLLFPKTKDERVLFESGGIKQLKLNEN
jgi:hypothetical protein